MSTQTVVDDITGQLDDFVSVIRVDQLTLGRSPRFRPDSDRYIATLTQSTQPWPPILVMAGSMVVVDGRQRVKACIARNQLEINARYFHGDPSLAFALAVQQNTTHGLGLTRQERNAAALNLLRNHPSWSDGLIADCTGLSAGTIGRLRRSTDSMQGLNSRLGRDGRTRPLSASTGRARAEEIVNTSPSISTRALSRLAGISVGTAHDVKRQMRVPRSADAQQDPATRPNTGDEPTSGEGHGARLRKHLERDPRIRLSENGRVLLKRLDQGSSDIDVIHRLARAFPHCAHLLSTLAKERSARWKRLAADLAALGDNNEHRVRAQTQGP